MSSIYCLVALCATWCIVEGAHIMCPVTFKKMGCYREDESGKLLINDRDASSALNQGETVDWYQWTNGRYPLSLGCRCNAAAKKAGFPYFGLRFYGLCIGIKKVSESSYDICYGNDYKSPCSMANKTEICIGGESADYLYEIAADGGFSKWTDWSKCSASCGDGQETRNRICDNPPVRGYGKPCKGPSTESRKCKLKECPVDGKFSPWKPYGSCSATCGGGVQERTRSCDNPAPEHGGKDCVGPRKETRKCNTKACAVDGKFSPWTKYGKCSATCGGGTQERTRTCTNPAPQNGGKDCVGPKKETRECNTEGCPVNGKYGPWGSYTGCDKTCGGGTQARTRKCDSPAPQNGGKDCVGPSKETRKCNTDACPVDGGFTDWSAYGSCSRTCGGGAMKATRTCTKPKPSNGGKDCVGPREKTKACKNNLCPGPAGVTKATEIVERFLTTFHKTSYPGKNMSAKFHQAIFAIQKAVREEFVSVDTSVSSSLEQRLKDLRQFLKTATEGGSIDFARSVLGKSLFVFMKKKIKEGLPIDTIDKAANGYLESIRKDIGDKKFDELISRLGDATLMFVIDTTGSMSQEINAAKTIARSIIEKTRKFDVNYILSPFNDPRTGTVTYKDFDHRSEFVSAIGGLRANGGGDCPELSFKGMINAMKNGPRYGSPMFVFTDASAKDATPTNIHHLISMAKRAKTTINFFTNLKGCGRGVPEYEEVARELSGNVFPLKNEAELLKFTTYVQSSLQSDTVLTSGGTLTRARRRRRSTSSDYQHFFIVDDTVGTLIVSLSVTRSGRARTVSLYDPTGKATTATASLNYASVYQFASPKLGKWRLSFPRNVGAYEYYIKAISKKAIEFDHSFVYQENPRKNSPPYTISNPLSGRNNFMLLQVGGIENVKKDTLKVNLLDSMGKYLMTNIPLNLYGNTDDIFNATFHPPTSPFKIELRGSTTLGSPFQRVAGEADQAAKAFLRPLSAGFDYSVRLGQKAKILMFLANTGSPETFNIRAEADTGSVHVEPGSDNVMGRSTTYISCDYQAPNDMSLKGKTASITVTATGTASGSTISDTIYILFMP